jgi:hypothetical protein
MRSSNIHRNGSDLSQITIREENENGKEIKMSRYRKDHYPSSAPAIHFSRSSIIGTHHGEFSIIN